MRSCPSPLAETGKFQEMVDSGVSLENIARWEACDVPHVEHRLKLLSIVSQISSEHVDIVSNDPLVGSQKLLAQVYLDANSRIGIVTAGDAKADENYMWSYLKSVVKTVDPDKNPTAFFKAIPQSIDATYAY